MSSHSRSSSEIESLSLKEALLVCQPAFLKDFIFGDVEQKLKYVFKDTDFQEIEQEPNQKNQIQRLIWVLYENEEIILDFLSKIEFEYPWLAEAVKREWEQPQKSTMIYIDKIKQLRSQYPQHTEYNVHRMEPYMKLRRALKDLKPHHKVVLFGDLCKGKKWLALDVCCEYSVMEAMRFKIFWLDVNSCNSPEEDLKILTRLLLELDEPIIRIEQFDDISNRKLYLQQQLKRKLHTDDYKDCLLVLKNVQNKKTLSTFDLGCKTLIITRNFKVKDSLPSSMTEHVDIDEGLTLQEFYCLFEKYLRCEREKFPKNACEIHSLSKGHPYLLSIIGQNLRQKKLDWDKWIKNLQNSDVADNKFTTVIEISLNVLSTELLELYATFAIFLQRFPVPINLLAILWDKTLSEAKDIIDTFHTFSLVFKIPQNEDQSDCELPFLYSSYLKNSVRIQKMINCDELHKKIIDYYKIEEAFENRTEIDSFNNRLDSYCFNAIGYHLSKTGRFELLYKTYTDFGFLERKIRAVGLANTIRDLKCYEEEIINCDQRRRQVLRNICDFLPKVEEKLISSKDTCLLQYALMDSGAVYEEAMRQIKQFPNKVWLTEKGNFHQRRHIVNLRDKANRVQMCDDDTCLVVLNNNNILLADISLDNANGSVEFVNDDEKQGVIDLRPFKNEEFMLTLHADGKLKLWTIKDGRRRMLTRRRSSKQKANCFNFHQRNEMERRKAKQTLPDSFYGNRVKALAFYMEELPAKNEISLHIAYENGDVRLFQWNNIHEDFEPMKVDVLHTNSKNIRFISKILSKFYLILNSAGHIEFWNTNDSSKVPASYDWPSLNSTFICCEVFLDGKYTCVFFVFGNKILRLDFEHQRFCPVLPASRPLEVLYESPNTQCEIRCAKLSRDGRYFVLGTKHGLIILDVQTKAEILHSNVSEVIRCVDIYCLDDPIFKYLIVCGSENDKMLKMYALRKPNENSITWSHNVASMGNEDSNDPQLEPGVWLLGQKLYDITYNDMTYVVAADSKNRIHQVCTTNTRNWSVITPDETSHAITAITTLNCITFAGFANGKIFNVRDETWMPKFTDIDAAISYLQLLDEQTLVAAVHEAPATSNKQSVAPATLIKNLEGDTDDIKVMFGTIKCFKIFEDFLLLINKHGFVLVLKGCEVKKLINDIEQNEDHFPVLGGCDFKNSVLFLATSTYKIYAYKFINKQDSLEVCNYPIYTKTEDSTKDNKVTCLAASCDANLVAVGLNSGDIDVYSLNNRSNTLNFVFCLQSHTVQIYDLIFSPYADVLVSCAEQLCFWSVAHMLNNPFNTNTKKRRSSRFTSQTSSDIEEVDDKLKFPKSATQLQVMNGSVLNGCNGFDHNNEIHTAVEAMTLTEPTTNSFALTTAAATSPTNSENPWQNKHGPPNKPELFACIKFDGKKAEKIFANPDFTQFNTIDDEGVYYHLTLFDPADINENNDNTNTAYGTINSINLYVNGKEIHRRSIHMNNDEDVFDGKIKI